MTPRALKRRVAAGTLWVSIETWSTQAAQMAVFVLLSRLLGPEAYGLLALALIVTTFADVLIVNGGWSDAIAQRREVTPADEASLFWFLLIASTVLGLMIWALAAPVGRLLDMPLIVPLIPWLALQLPLSALGVVPKARLRRELSFAPLALRGFVSQLVAGGVAVALASGGAGIWSLVALQIMQPLVDTLVIWSATRWRPTQGLSARALREIMPFVGGSLGDRLVVAGDNILQRSLIGLALGPIALGFYTFARKILELLLQSVSRPLSRVLLPSAARLRDDPSGLARLIGGAAQLAGLVAFPAAAGLAVIAPELVPVIFGAAWAPAVPLVQALMVAAAAGPFSQIAATLIYASGATRWQLALSLLGAALMLALLLALGRQSLAGVAIALVVRPLVMLPIRLLVARHASGIDLPRLCRPALAPLAAALVMGAAVAAARLLLPAGMTDTFRLCILVPLGGLSYLVAVLIVARPALRSAIGLARSLRHGEPIGPAPANG